MLKCQECFVLTSTFSAFKIIREAYYQQLESRGDKTDPELSSWLEWREKNKPSKPLLVSVNRPPQSFSLSSGGRQVAGSVKSPAISSLSSPATPVLPVTKQQVVLPTRPLPVSNTSTSLTNSSVASVKLPTSPVITGGVSGSLPMGRTIATTTLTAAQLQQLAAARGQVFVSGLQTQVRAGAGQVAVAGGPGGVRQVTQIARGGQIVRQGGQTSLIVSQQPRQALAVQRPLLSGQVVARSVRPPGQQIMVAASPRPGAQGQQIMVGGRGVTGGQLVMASAGQLRQGGVMVVTTSAGSGQGGVIVQSTSGATRQHYVISGTQAGGQAQIVALQPGQNIRQGQIVQVGYLVITNSVQKT